MPYRPPLLLAALLAGCSLAAPASQLCVVRHAESYKNLPEPPGDLDAGQLDALTPAGRDRARAIAEELPKNVARVWASPTGRTRETAAALGHPVVVDDGLRPIEGDLPWEARVEGWARGEDPRPGGGESLADAAVRVEATVDRLRDGLPSGAVAVAVTHGDVASLLLGALRGTPLLQRPTRDGLATGSVACLPLPPAGAR